MVCCSLLWSTFFYGGIAFALFKLYLKYTTGWCWSQRCLVGKTAIVTGANTGIGYETAIDLAKRGAKVILACRNETLAKEATEKIINETDNPNVSYKLVDFTSLDSVRKFAQEINDNESRLDILVNNAGVANLPNKLSDDGLLIGMQANHYGPFLLTILLLDLLKKTESSRIINVSSRGAERRMPFDVETLNTFDNAVNVYGRSKLCNILFTIELAKRLKGTTVTAYSLHPGAVSTKMPDQFFFEPLTTIFSSAIRYLGKNCTEGAQTTIYCAIAKGIEEHSGEHFSDCARIDRYKTADGPELPGMLWEQTEKDLKLSKQE